MHKIAVIPGDCTGPEVVREGLKVLKKASENFNFQYELSEYDFGGERYLRTGDILPREAISELRQADAHLSSSDIDEALALVPVDRSAPPVRQGYELLNACVTSLYEIADILGKWA